MRHLTKYLFYLFITGSITRIFLAILFISIELNSVDRGFGYIKGNISLYLLLSGSSGAAWVALGTLWRHILDGRSTIAYATLVIASAAIIGPTETIIMQVADHILNGGVLATNAFDPLLYWRGSSDVLSMILDIARGALLISIVWRSNAARPISNDRDDPATMLREETDRTTRILCGQAILGGSAFRQRITGFYGDNWIAVAPEHGLDMQLICSVCEFADERDRNFYFLMFFIGLSVCVVALKDVELAVLLLLCASGAARFWKVSRDLVLADGFTRSSFRIGAAVAKYARWQSDTIRRRLPPTDQNVVVYKGFSPFVGSGLDLDGWLIVTRVDKPDREKGITTIRNFGERDIYAALKAGVQDLRLDNLSCRKMAFVRGIDVREDRTLMGDLSYRPLLSLPEETIDDLLQAQKNVVRGYMRIQHIAWGGDVIITFYVRLSIEGRNLVLEVKKYILPPISSALRQVDATPPDRLGLMAHRLLASLIVGPLLTLVSPLLVLGEILGAAGRIFSNEDRESEHRRRRVEENLSFDYGASASLREIFGQRRFAHYFQKADSESITRLIERKILNVVEEFLESHGIDASDFRDRQTSILNSGIIVQGGDVRAEALAVGQGATASKAESQRPSKSRESAT